MTRYPADCGQSIRTPDAPRPARTGHPDRMAVLLPYAVIVALYAVCILVVNPRGEFPLNDDWSYSRSAFVLAAENRMVIDEFSAPTLVGQAVYGALLIKIFGKSFLVLRLSTLLLSCATSCLLWRSFRLCGAGPGLAWIGVLTWVFNPIQFWSSFTFMTEIPSLFCISAAAAAFAYHLAARKTWPLVLCGAALGYAFLIRQTSVLFMAAAGLCLCAEQTAGGRRQKAWRLAVFASAAAVFAAAFYRVTPGHGVATAAARRKFELLGHLTAEQVVGNLFGSLFYLAFFLLPLLACLIPFLKERIADSGKWRRILSVPVWILSSVFGLWWFHSRYAIAPYLPARPFHAQMPFLLNVLFDTGLGPVTLDPTYYGPPPTPVHPRIWLCVTFLVAAGLVVLGLHCTCGLPRLLAPARRSWQRTMALFCGASLAATLLFEVVFSHTQEGGLFDRHVLTAALPLIILVCILANPNDPRTAEGGVHSNRVRPAFMAAATLMLGVLAWFCMTATHDYLAWNRLRWDLGSALLAQNVDPLSVSGGFEFNAWHNYDKFRARGHAEKVFYWWYDRLDYLITMEPQEDYSVVRKLEYYSWLHQRNLPVYLLRRK